MNIFLVVIAIIIYFAKSADFIYLFQIKEYRFDRFHSLLRETGYFNLFYLRSIRLPARSPRNLLIAFGLFICAVFYGFEFYDLGLDRSFTSGLVTLLAAPIAAYFTVAGLVLLTEILAQKQRRSVISQARHLIHGSKTVFIGITGSYGKSSTKEFLYQILSHKFKTGKTEANMNTTVGVAKSILRNLKADTQFFIVEMGAYRRGEISEICHLTPPKYGILTAIGNQHVDLFGSRHQLLLGKKELLEQTKQRVYVNRTIEGYDEIISALEADVVSFSMEQSFPSDVVVTQLSSDHPISATVTYKEVEVSFTTHILGKHNVSNLLPCIALALDLGISPAEISAALEDLEQPDNKLSLHHTKAGAHLLLDNYNTSVEGFQAALDVLASQTAATKIVVTKGIIELGHEKDHSYRMLMKHLNTINAQMITTDKLFKDLDAHHRVTYVSTEHAVEEVLKPHLNNETMILIEGKFTTHFLDNLLEKRHA